ncbi:MAG: PaaI family thioesterase [Myxococcota bacterium]
MAEFAKLTREFDRLVPLNRAMGMHLVSLEAGTATIRLPWDDRFLGDAADGLVHGGVLTTLLDTTCGMAAFMGLRTPGIIATLDLRIDHLRPATVGAELVAEGTTVRATRQVLFVRGVAHHGDPAQPVAQATATFAVTS